MEHRKEEQPEEQAEEGAAYLQPPSKSEPAGEKMFTLEQALGIWEAGAIWYEDNEDWLKGFECTPVDRWKYFKDKFGIILK